jgi:hypothetical protein
MKDDRDRVSNLVRPDPTAFASQNGLGKYTRSPLLLVGGLLLSLEALREVLAGSRQWVYFATFGIALVIVWVNQWLYFANVKLYTNGESLVAHDRLGRRRNIRSEEVHSLVIMNVRTLTGTQIQVLMALDNSGRCLLTVGNASFFDRCEIEDLALGIGTRLEGPTSTVLSETELATSYPGSVPAGAQLLAWPVRHPVLLGLAIFLVIFTIAALQLFAALPH